MKSLHLSRIVLVALCCVFAAIGPAAANVSIAVVDVQMLLTESKAAQSIQKQLQAQRETLQKEVSGREQKLRETEKELVEQSSSMSQEQIAQKRQAFESELLETRRLIQKEKRILEEAFVRASGKLREEILKIVAEMADERGYQLVLTRQNVVIVEKTIDISAEVMKKLDSSVTEIKLDVKSQ